MQDRTVQPFPESPIPNPFRDDVFSSESSLPGISQIHEDAVQHCINAITSLSSGGRLGEDVTDPQQRGEIILISSPLAGYGKSHLIGRVSRSVLETVHSVPLSLSPDTCWEGLLSHVIDYQSCQVSSALPGATRFEETAATFLLNLIQFGLEAELISERECPSSLSLANLSSNFSVFFDPASPKLLAWLKKKVPVLQEIARIPQNPFDGLSKKDLCFWGKYFIDFLASARRSPDIPVDISTAVCRERTLQYLRISVLSRPLLIIADHLDICHGSDTAGMEIASIITTIAERIPSCLIILSLNQDLWESVFAPKLPSAYLDRLRSEPLYLGSLSHKEAAGLVVTRLHDHGFPAHQAHRFSSALAKAFQWEENAILYPRSVIRQAREFWNECGDRFSDAADSGEGFAKSYPDSFRGEPSSSDPADFAMATDEDEEGDSAPEWSFTTFPVANRVTDPFSGQALVYPDRPVDDPQDSFPQKFPRLTNTPGPREVISEPEKSPSTGYPVPQLADDVQSRLPAAPPTSPINGPWNGNGSKTAETGNGNGSVLTSCESNRSAWTPENLKDYLAHLESMQAKKGSPTLDLPELAEFINKAGRHHPSIVQREVEIPGDENQTLLWESNDQSIWIGFELSSNAFCYSNLLQRLLSDSDPGKIIAFSHASQRFARTMFLWSGVSEGIFDRHFDIIHMSDHELFLIQAASQFLDESEQNGCLDQAIPIALNRLSPLWNRMVRRLNKKA